MNSSQMEGASCDRIEITLRTDASLGLSERAKCEEEIRKIFEIEGVKIVDLSFRDGSTIITFGLLVVSGLAFCFAHFFGAALARGGEYFADFLKNKGKDIRGKSEVPKGNHLPLATESQVKSIIRFEFPEEVGFEGRPKEARTLMISAETAGYAVEVLMYSLPGSEKSITAKATTYNVETQERVEEIYQKRISKC